MKKINPAELYPGDFFAVRENGSFELVRVDDATRRPDSWFKEGYTKVEVYTMGWDCTASPDEWQYFVEVEFQEEPLVIVPVT